jgi:peptidoglycan glycosyltransferase
VRFYPERAAEPVVGYYSLRYGVGGAEAAFDKELRGMAGPSSRLDALVNNLLHRIPPGRPVRLTLDLSVQQAADTALADHTGAVVVLSVPEGEVIALVSHPTFDPATLDTNWERLRTDPSSPLLNRATQGSYQPGAAFQTIVLAEALQRGMMHLTDTVPSVNVPVSVDNTLLRCAVTPPAETLAAAFAAGCPAPFAALAGQLGSQNLADAIHRWQLDVAPDHFELPVHISAFTSASLTTTQAVRDLALGQGALTVSPLKMASIAGIIANGGRPIAAPHLKLGTASISPTPSILFAEIANAIQASLSPHGGQSDLGGQVALALSGESKLTWFIGFAPSTSPRWVIVVLLENGNAATSYQIAAQIGAKLVH